jgi:hypothetical protein
VLNLLWANQTEHGIPISIDQLKASLPAETTFRIKAEAPKSAKRTFAYHLANDVIKMVCLNEQGENMYSSEMSWEIMKWGYKEHRREQPQAQGPKPRDKVLRSSPEPNHS